MQVGEASRRIYEGVQDARMTVAVTAGNLALSLLAPSDFSVHADYPFGEQMARAVPSAFVTPPASGISPDVALLGLEVAPITVGFELARRTARKLEQSKWGLLGTAMFAQMFSSAADSGFERTGLMSKAELVRPDNGSSGVLAGYVTKASLDRWAEAKSKGEDTQGRLWLGGLAAFGILMTSGAYATDGIDGKLDVVAHTAGMAAGALAHLGGRLIKAFKTRRQARKADKVHDEAGNHQETT